MTQSFYEFFCPVKVISGTAALEHVPFELSVLNASKPLIITDKGVRGAGLVEVALKAFEGSTLDVGAIYDDVPPDSSLEIVRSAAELYRSKGCDSIIAIGGGSVIDTSKGVNILVSENSNDLHKFSGAGNLKKALKPFFVIPTTAGTGSEVTLVAVIADKQKGVKMPFTSHFLYPNAAVIDPRMTLTLPPHITAATGMDALTHAVEAFTCMAKNPLSDAYALGAIKKIGNNLLKVMDNPKDKLGRLELAEASTMAGIAFSNSMVGLVHALGHSLGAHCHLPHGLCMSLFLPYVLEFNIESIREPLADILLALAGPDVYAATPANRRAEMAITKIRELRDELHSRCKLPRTLKETGKVERNQLSRIADLSIDDGSIIFNPIQVNYEDALAVLERAWE